MLWYIILVLITMPLITYNVEHLFMGSVALLLSYWVTFLFKYLSVVIVLLLSGYGFSFFLSQAFYFLPEIVLLLYLFSITI